MKKFLKISGIILFSLVALYIVSCFFGPSHFFIEKKIVINASQDSIFNQVANYSKWNAWSPWSEADPQMKSQFIEEPLHVGHKWSWTSESQGNGSQTILALDYPNKIRMELNFEGMDPSYTHWNFSKRDQGVEVSWDMDGGEVPFFQRGMMLLFQGMIEDDYEKGLNKLKLVCEKN